MSDEYSTIRDEVPCLGPRAVCIAKNLCHIPRSKKLPSVKFRASSAVDSRYFLPNSRQPFKAELIVPGKSTDMMTYNGLQNPPSQAQVQMKSRERLVEERMHLKLREYVDIHPFQFFVGTWNVNGRCPRGNETLDIWLTDIKADPHFYVIGFQELDLDKRAYVLETSMQEKEWQKAVEKSLKKKGHYRQVKMIRLVGMMLLVYVVDKHFHHIKNISAAVVGTGIMGWMGNKGGVGIRLDFHGSEMCFVTAHFAAHTEEVERRNEDFKNVCDKMTFQQLEYPKRIKEHDIIVWLGDFNYRIAGLARKEVEELVSANRITELATYDQLKLQMSQKKVFHGFKEGDINFRPTYKYDTGTDKWDSGEKMRVPSWCDRILWKHNEGEDVKLISYDSRMQMTISDHKPVIALFQIGIKVVDKIRHKKVYEQVLKNIDREENSLIPQASIDYYDFNFGDITFLQPVTKKLTVANTGQVPVVFEFITKPGCPSYCKDWLSITPQRSFISPGDVCYVEMVMEVDKKTVADLTSKVEKLEDILVLHLEGGKDFFLTIQANYLPSCFGMSLETLASTKQSVRPQAPPELLVQIDDQPSAILHSNQFPNRPSNVPVEIWMIIAHLYVCSTNVPDLFIQPGMPDELEKIRDHLDLRLPLPLPGSGHSVACIFLLYLDALPEPLVPYQFYQRCLEASSNLQLSRQVVEEFPKVHRATFIVVIVFLRELQTQWRANNDQATLEMIAELILRTPPDSIKNMPLLVGAVGKGAVKQVVSKKKTDFLQKFLDNRFTDEPVLPRTFGVMPDPWS